MTKDLLLSTLKELPEQSQTEVLHYAAFLKSRYDALSPARKKRVFRSTRQKVEIRRGTVVGTRGVGLVQTGDA
jgi:hypothetical protein